MKMDYETEYQKNYDIAKDGLNLIKICMLHLCSSHEKVELVIGLQSSVPSYYLLTLL